MRNAGSLQSQVEKFSEARRRLFESYSPRCLGLSEEYQEAVARAKRERESELAVVRAERRFWAEHDHGG